MGKIFIIAVGGLAADFCLSSIMSIHMVFRILLNTVNMFFSRLLEFSRAMLVHNCLGEAQ